MGTVRSIVAAARYRLEIVLEDVTVYRRQE